MFGSRTRARINGLERLVSQLAADNMNIRIETNQALDLAAQHLISEAGRLDKAHKGFIKSVVTRLDNLEAFRETSVATFVSQREWDSERDRLYRSIQGIERYSPAAIAKEREMHDLAQLMLYPSKLWNNCDFAAAPAADPTAQSLKELRDATTLTVENEAGAPLHNVPLKAVVMQVLDFLKLKPQSVAAQRAGVKLVKVPAKKK